MVKHITASEFKKELDRAKADMDAAFVKYMEDPTSRNLMAVFDARLNLGIILQMQRRDLHEGFVDFDK